MQYENNSNLQALCVCGLFWQLLGDPDKGKATSLGPLKQEVVRNSKYGRPFDAPILFAFLTFVTSCSGSFRLTAT